MTISIKPTASGSTIEQDGSQVLSIESDKSVDIDSGTLHVDATNNRVGIGTSSPAQKLQVSSTGDNVILSSGGSGAAGYIVANGNGRSNLTGGLILLSYSNGTAEINNSSNSNLLFKTNSAERMRIDSSGNVGIGITTPNTYLVVYGNTGTAVQRIFNVNGVNTYLMSFHNSVGEVGTITTGSGSTSYNTSSDYRLKENVAPMSGSINRLKQLKPSTWSWVQDGSHGEGFLAHEAQTVVPEAVTGIKDAMRTEEYEVTPAVTDDEGNVVTEAVMGTREVPVYQGIDQSKLVPLLTAALQEAITKIEALEARVATLEGN